MMMMMMMQQQCTLETQRTYATHKSKGLTGEVEMTRPRSCTVCPIEISIIIWVGSKCGYIPGDPRRSTTRESYRQSRIRLEHSLVGAFLRPAQDEAMRRAGSAYGDASPRMSWRAPKTCLGMTMSCDMVDGSFQCDAPQYDGAVPWSGQRPSMT